MTVYATVAELRASLTSTHASMPEIADDDDALTLLTNASELIDEHTLNRAQQAYDLEEDVVPPDPTPYRDALSLAACRQVEFWLEVGPEHDIAGLRGSLVAGRIQIHPVAKVLGQRAKRALQNAGLYWAGAAIG